MAMTSEQQNQNRNNSPLQISASDYYFETMRPYLNKMRMECSTDQELLRTIDKVINASDSFCQDGKYNMVADSFDVLEAAINDKNYFNGVMSKAPETEKELVRGLSAKITDLRMIIQYEPKTENEKPKIKERLSYSPPSDVSPNGENNDYSIHNMKILNEPHPKTRLPNV